MLNRGHWNALSSPPAAGLAEGLAATWAASLAALLVGTWHEVWQLGRRLSSRFGTGF